MKQYTMRHAVRVAGAFAAVALVMSCEPATAPDELGNVVGGSLDNIAPSVRVTAVGARRDTVDVNSPLNLSVTATDTSG
jgi:hypothetical protein